MAELERSTKFEFKCASDMENEVKVSGEARGWRMFVRFGHRLQQLEDWADTVAGDGGQLVFQGVRGLASPDPRLGYHVVVDQRHVHQVQLWRRLRFHRSSFGTRLFAGTDGSTDYLKMKHSWERHGASQVAESNGMVVLPSAVFFLVTLLPSAVWSRRWNNCVIWVFQRRPCARHGSQDNSLLSAANVTHFASLWIFLD